MHSTTIPTRCFWYKNDGEPYKRRDGGHGCPFSTCLFAHPWQIPDWKHAVETTKLPAIWNLAPDEAVKLYGTSSPGPIPRKSRRSRSRSNHRDRHRDRGRSTERFKGKWRDTRRSWSRGRGRSRNRDRQEHYSKHKRRSLSPVPRHSFTSGIGKYKQRASLLSRLSDTPADDVREKYGLSSSIRSSRSPPPYTPDRGYRQRSPYIKKEPPTEPRAFRGRESSIKPAELDRADPSKGLSSAIVNDVSTTSGLTTSVSNDGIVPVSNAVAGPSTSAFVQLPATSSVPSSSAVAEASHPDSIGTPISIPPPIQEARTPRVPSLQDINSILTKLKLNKTLSNIPTTSSAPTAAPVIKTASTGIHTGSVPSQPVLPGATPESSSMDTLAVVPVPERASVLTPATQPVPVATAPEAVTVPAPLPTGIPTLSPALLERISALAALSTQPTLSQEPSRTSSAVIEAPQQDIASDAMAVDSTVSSRAPSVTPDPDADEQKKIWETRIKLLAEVLTRHESLANLDASRALQDRLIESLDGVDSLLDKGKFKADAISLNARRIGVSREYREAVAQISASEAWKLLRLEPRDDEVKIERVKVDDKAKEMIEDVKNAITVVMGSVKELYGVLHEMGGKKSITIPPAPGVQSNSMASNEDVEMATVSSSPRIRNTNVRDNEGIADGDTEVPAALTVFREQVRTIEDKLKEVETSLSQRQEEISEEIQTSLDSQFNELKDSVERNTTSHPDLTQAKILSEQNAERLNALHGEVSKTGNDIEELAAEVADTIRQINEVVAGSEKLQEENRSLRSEIERLQKELAASERRQVEELARMRADTDELKVAFEAQLQRQQRPSTPPLPSPESLLPLILPHVQTALQPLFASLHETVRGLLTAEVDHLQQDVSRKVEMLLGILRAFEGWADNVRDSVDPGYLLRRVPPGLVTNTS